jgi:hypothetical protein
MPFILALTSTRITVPDIASLQIVAQTLDPTCVVSPDLPTAYNFLKSTAWTAPQITAAQTALDTSVATSPELTAQSQIDQMSDFNQAIVLLILDQLNLIRSKLPVPLIAITPAQAIAAIRAKAATL